MRRTVLTRLVPVFVFLAVSLAASAATIPSPYHPTASPATAARLAAEGQEGLDLDVKALAALRDGVDSVVEIDAFPVAPGESARLRLSRFEVVAPDAKVIIEGKGGRTTAALAPVKDFRGIVEGEPDSTVYVGVATNMVVAWVHSSRGHVYVGPNEANDGYVVRNANSPLNAVATATPWRCDQESLPQHVALPAPAGAAGPAAVPMVAGFKQAMVDVETDNQLWNFFGGSLSALTTYVHTLYGADNVIYDRDVAMHLTVQNIHTWSTPDPYNGADTLTQLLQLGDWWHTNMPLASHPRTMVHYLSGHPVTGGIAWVGVLCSPDQAFGSDWAGAYSLTQVFGTYPLQIWDIDATSHEQGHNAGSIHTHCMGPPEGYPDWTDECYSGEVESPPCYSGPTSVPPGKGTIMSYCHLLPGGFDNINLVFHTRCINDYMLPEINGVSCLASPATFVDVPTTNPFFHWVENVYQVGITSGCSANPLMYCPYNSVTRQQMAAFLMKSEHGSGYVPPACTPPGPFPDVPCSSNFAVWIQQLVAEHITTGCGSGDYCPTDPVTRQQMAVFLLKTEHGSAYSPPACTPPGPFPDVLCSSNFAPWIQQLVIEGITGGCAGGNYCPTNPVTRAQMAVFLTKTFNLGW